MNHPLARVLLLALPLALLLPACRPAEEAPAAEAERVFRFDSGGAWHLEGYGAWHVALTSGREIRIEHQVNDEVRTFLPVELAAADAERLWDAVDHAALAKLVITERPGVPDEIRRVFALEADGAEAVRVELWANDLADHPGLVELVAELRGVVERTTGEKPVF